MSARTSALTRDEYVDYVRLHIRLRGSDREKLDRLVTSLQDRLDAAYADSRGSEADASA